jgi:ABC-type antimicrobial peptide transport system permease subunit
MYQFYQSCYCKSYRQAKEVGLRKVLGAVRKQLVSQFMMESILFATAASVLSFGLVQILMPAYTNLLGYQLPSFWNDARVYGFIIVVIIIVGLLAGKLSCIFTFIIYTDRIFKREIKNWFERSFL